MRSGNELVVSRAEKSDYEAILALHHDAGWVPSRVEGEVWGAWEGRELVGSVQFEEVGKDFLFVRAMVVRRDSRNRGIGAQMFREVMATRDAEWWLECRQERIRFYSRLGFVVVEQRNIPAAVRQLVRARTDREQFFMQKPRVGQA
ncbi:MAG: Acetyltransferase domain [Gaiellaceae bacterium]|nr:Acetyltransferase domain [Gaiellaceae bacterium]